MCVFMYICVYVFMYIFMIRRITKMNRSSFPFQKRENPLTPATKQTRVSEKEKYTAVMEKDLRVRVKIAAAKKSLQFSQYIEEAVLEKLEREGL